MSLIFNFQWKDIEYFTRRVNYMYNIVTTFLCIYFFATQFINQVGPYSDIITYTNSSRDLNILLR